MRTAWGVIGAAFLITLLFSYPAKAAEPLEVAIYFGDPPCPHGARGMHQALSACTDLAVVRLETLAPETLVKHPILIMGGATGLAGADLALPYEEILQNYVCQGGALVVTHFSTGFVMGVRKTFPKSLFPEIWKPVGKADALAMNTVKGDHPILSGLPPVIEHAYVDHVQLATGPAGTALTVDDDGKAVAVCGAHGNGRVLALGNLVGYAAKERTLKAYAGEERPPEGGELTLLVNGIKWLAGADSSALDSPEALASFAEIAGMPASSASNREAAARGFVILPEPQSIKILEGRCSLSAETALVVSHEAQERGDYLGIDMLNERLAKRHGFTLAPVTEAPDSTGQVVIGNPSESEAVATLCRTWNVDVPDNDEGYCLVARDDIVLIAARAARGACYGVQSLIQLLRRDKEGTYVPNVSIRDWPDAPVRGMLVGLSAGGRSTLAYAKRMMQLLVHLKANTVTFMARNIIYEGMPEFRRRRLRSIDRSTAWTKEDLVELADEAHAIGLNVIPGTLSLGHSGTDRLPLDTPELADYVELNEKGEREPSEDCFCWSSPKVKELFLDYTEMLIEATRPNAYIHLMSDEIYHFGICPRCKNKDQAQLFADYVKTMYAQAASHGLGLYMWPDLLLENNAPTTFGATGFHGWRNIRTGPAIELIPKDIVMNPWFYGPGRERPVYKYLIDKGFPVVACPGGTGPPPQYSKANCYYAGIEGKKYGFLGFVAFAWEMNYRYPRSLISEPMEYCWTIGRPIPQEHEDYDLAAVQDLAFLPPTPAMLPGRKSFPIDLERFRNTGLVHGEGGGGWFKYGPSRDFRDFEKEDVRYEEVVFDLPDATVPKACVMLAGGDELGRFTSAAGVAGILVKRKAASLVFLHTCMTKRNDHRREIARYTIHYAGGESEIVPVRFGEHIAGWVQTGIGIRDYVGWQIGPGYLAKASLAYHRKNARGERMTLQAYEWVNPYPASDIESIDAEITAHDVGVRLAVLAVSGVTPTPEEIAASPPLPDPPCAREGLVSYWAFDEGEGDEARDVMGRNPARVRDATWAQGAKGSALSFDGQGDYVDLGEDESLLYAFADGDFTFEFRMRTDATQAARLMGRFARAGRSGGSYVNLTDQGKLLFFMYADNGRNPQSVTSKRRVNDGQWRHVTAVREGPVVSLYVDGALEATNRYEKTCVLRQGISMYLGTEWIGDKETYKGLLDEVRFYRRALTPEEVKGNFEGRVVRAQRPKSGERPDKGASAKVAEAPSSDGAAGIVREGLLSYWSFDEGKGDTAGCSAGGKAARLHGASWAEGIRGKALSFDGKDDYARTDLNEKLLLGKSDFTLEAWVSTGSLAGMRIVGNQMYGGSPGYSLSISEGKPAAMAMERSGTHQYVQGETYVADTDWHQIVAVRKGGLISLYVDGVLDKRVERPVCDISPPDRSPEATWFGMARFEPEPMNPFQGAIDEVRFYGRALRPEEVKRNYQAAAGPEPAGRQ